MYCIYICAYSPIKHQFREPPAGTFADPPPKGSQTPCCRPMLLTQALNTFLGPLQ